MKEDLAEVDKQNRALQDELTNARKALTDKQRHLQQIQVRYM